jgi:hypothetical protein
MQSMTGALTLAYALGRVCFGAGLLGPPRWMATRWIGPDAGRRPVQTAVRGLAARDIAIAVGLADAVRREAPARPWLAASVGSDLADIAATLAAGDSLPERARWGTVALAGASAAAGAALLAAESA